MGKIVGRGKDINGRSFLLIIFILHYTLYCINVNVPCHSTAPLMHVFWTSVGLGLGYRGHIFEETSEERYIELIKKHKNAPWYPKGQLLAERYAREKAEREGELNETLIS